MIEKMGGRDMPSSTQTEIATIPALLRDLVARHGDRTQIIGPDGALSFREVERRSAAMARGLLASGVGKGEKVGILMGNGCDWVVAWFAAERIGAVTVLLSTFAKPRELAFMLRHADVRTLLAQGRFLRADFVERLEAALPALADQREPGRLRLEAAPFLRHIWISAEQRPAWSMGHYADLANAAGAEDFAGEMFEAVEREVTTSDPALIMYTSGTTSDPKAVLHRHGAVARHAYTMAAYNTFKPDERCMTTQPLFWVGGLCTSLLVANICGAALLCPDTPSPADMLRALREGRGTHITLWPPQIAALMDLPDFTPEDFKRLRPATAMQLALFKVAPPERTPNSLGMSETFGPHSGEYPDDVLPPGREGSFGRGIADIERKIIDPATGEALPVGVEGELCIRGYSVMMGFYKKERSEVFEPDGFFRTGDICRIDEEGYLYFNSRRNEMIKTSGANVAPREVELLLASTPGVLEAAVMGLPDARLGQMVAAVVIPQVGVSLDEAELKAVLRDQLADYKVPKRIFVMSPDEIPRTDSAKIRKPQLVPILVERLEREAGA
jgi:acyl-CoA synthetase (AMP-forming)/AMP-acid ligase II